MPDHYSGPSLVLMGLFLPAFGYLFLRYRNVRTLLWFLGFLFALLSSVLLYDGVAWACPQTPWAIAFGETSLLICTALLLASLSPLSFRIGRVRILFALPYFVPLVVYSLFYYGVFQGKVPHGPLDFWFPALGVLSFCGAALWCAQKGALPRAVSLGICLVGGVVCFWAYFMHDGVWALRVAEDGNLLITAMLIAFSFRRFSPGVCLSMTGVLVWSLHGVESLPFFATHSLAALFLIRFVALGKVVAAVGMVFLSLEDELRFNQVAREREQRARVELAAYTGLVLSRRRVEDFDHLGDYICKIVVGSSRFGSAALLSARGGHFKMTGSAGLEENLEEALRRLVARMEVADFPSMESVEPLFESGQAFHLDLRRWLLPGETPHESTTGEVLAVPMRGRATVEGFMLLSSVRSLHNDPEFDCLRTDDLLPIELLVARIHATLNHIRTLEKLIDTERFAGVGQLTSNVAQRLRDPLTVIMGYAALLEDGEELTEADQIGVRAILDEARQMGAILDSLSRVSSQHGDSYTAVSIVTLFADLEQLWQKEFVQRHIEFKTEIPATLRRVMCREHELRQAVVHCLQFCMTALDIADQNVNAEGQHTGSAVRSITVEARQEGDRIRIAISHTGKSFDYPERAFDPFTPAFDEDEAAGMPLSICATMLRENNGSVLAVNLEPRGATIIFELKAA